MKARLYLDGVLLGETTLRVGPKKLGPADTITVALVPEHPKPNEKPLFLTGRLETA